jgi:hypothetical protein
MYDTLSAPIHLQIYAFYSCANIQVAMNQFFCA